MNIAQIPFDDDVWELYDTTKDWSQANDLSKQMPEKLHELQRLWLIEAVKYNVLPLDDRFAERANPEIAGRPQLTKGNRQLFFGGMGRLTENSIVNYKNKSHAVTAEVVVPESGDRTVDQPRIDCAQRLVVQTVSFQAADFEVLDEDISIEGLLAGRPSGESQASLAKWLAWRKKR